MPDWIVKHNVPILDEHEIRDEDGKVICKIDGRRLEEIAERANKRVAETGDLVPIVIGHTKDEAPETKQPEIVGYACNFNVGNLFRSGRRAVKATFKFFKDKAHLVKKYPRRSVELWFSDWKIDPIALLGATTPERDLGLLQLSRGGQRHYRRILSNKPVKLEKQPVDNVKQIVKAVIAELQNTAVWQWAEQQMQAQEQEPGLEEPGMGPEMGPGLEGDPMQAEMNEGLDNEEPLEGEGGEEGEDEDEKPARYSTPSGTNTFTPGGVARRRRSPDMRCARRPAAADRVRMVRDQTALALAQYQRGYYALAEQFEDLRLRYQRAEREKDLIQLEAEGVQLDREEELERLGGLDQESYAKELQIMRRRYTRAPVNGRFVVDPSQTRSAVPSGRQRSREDMRKIADFAVNRGISYQQALAEFDGDVEPVF